MSENEGIPGAQSGPDHASSMTAGQMLRAAREQSGMQLNALAAAIKVAAPKLEALENDRLEQLPDATFARALAKTVCRFLKIDAEPVLARLPDVRMSELEHVAQGLNQPFRDGPHRQDLFKAESLRRPAVLVPLLLLVGAVVLWALPPGMLQRSPGGAEPAAGVTIESTPNGVSPAASEVALPAPAASEFAPPPGSVVPAVPPVGVVPAVPSPAVTPPSAAPAVPAASAPGAASAAVGATDAVVVRTQASSWVEVRDAGGQTLLSREMAAGEAVTLRGRFPMRLQVGNAGATEITARGQAVDLRPHARNNIARLEIQ